MVSASEIAADDDERLNEHDVEEDESSDQSENDGEGESGPEELDIFASV